MRLVLREYANVMDSGIETIRQGEIDDAELAAKVERWFRPPLGQFVQSGTTTTRQNQRQGIACRVAEKSSVVDWFVRIHCVIFTRKSRHDSTR